MALTDERLIEVPGMASRWVRLGNGSKAHCVSTRRPELTQLVAAQ